LVVYATAPVDAQDADLILNGVLLNSFVQNHTYNLI
jgi:hypothetical protein